MKTTNLLNCYQLNSLTIGSKSPQDEQPAKKKAATKDQSKKASSINIKTDLEEKTTDEHLIQFGGS